MELRAEEIKQSILNAERENIKEKLFIKLRYLLYYIIQCAKIVLYATIGLGSYIFFYLLPNPITQAVTILIIGISVISMLRVLRQIAFIQEAKYLYKSSMYQR